MSIPNYCCKSLGKFYFAWYNKQFICKSDYFKPLGIHFMHMLYAAVHFTPFQSGNLLGTSIYFKQRALFRNVQNLKETNSNICSKCPCSANLIKNWTNQFSISNLVTTNIIDLKSYFIGTHHKTSNCLALANTLLPMQVWSCDLLLQLFTSQTTGLTQTDV